MRTTYDLEMMRQVGSCSGIENYSRHIDGRVGGLRAELPARLLPRRLPARHRRVARQTVPQLGAMYEGDMSRKGMLVDHGFRLPSAMDNRPLTFEEFLDRISQAVFLSATPGPYELPRSRRPGHRRADRPAHRPGRPARSCSSRRRARSTTSSTRSTLRTERNERVLVTTLTKKMAEDLTDYLLDKGIRVRYLHSDIDTLRRVEILRDLRLGEFDVLVGINLLREGLDLPEVSLVRILDADKEGFLRSERSLIQTIGRAARNVGGQVLMYADNVTDSMRRGPRRDLPAAREADRVQRGARHRPAADAQEDRRHHRPAGPRGRRHRAAARQRALAVPRPGDQDRRGWSWGAGRRRQRVRRRPAGSMAAADLASLIQELTTQMHAAAADLHFELAARLRDELGDLKKELRQMTRATS